VRDLHPVLRRQLSRHVKSPESLPEALKAFLEVVNAAYHQADEDRKLLERTMDLSSQEMMETNAELRRIKDEAQTASRAKSEFLSNMRHELRTPLNAVVGFAGLLAEAPEGSIDPEHREFAENIVTSSRSLLTLVNGLLDLANVDAGRLTLRRGPVDVGVALNDAAKTIQRLADERGVSLGVDLESGLPAVDADEARLKQILHNLLDNALKFTPPGGRVVLAARRGSGDDATVAISVADTGVGIAAEDHERIFGRFEQLDPSATRAYAGTGLGLSLSRKLVELHGGALAVESEVGKGSIFTFWLPSMPSQAAAAR
jgi:two-component system, NarL family, sensor histidine kinase EvgS